MTNSGEPGVYTSDELALEREMSRRGEEKYYALSLAARQHDQLSVTVPGRALVRKFVERVEEQILGFMERTAKGAAKNADAAIIIRELGAPLCAFLTTATIVDRLHRWMPLLELSKAVARMIEDEVRMRAVRKEHPEVFRDILRKTKTAGPATRRRLALTRAGAWDALPPAFPISVKTRLGTQLVDLFQEATGLLEFELVVVSKRKTQYHVGPSKAAEEWIANAEERVARATVFYLPTVDLPATWVGPEGGGYLTDLVLRRPIARFRGAEHESLIRKGDAMKDYPAVLGALNRLQRTKWTINEDVLVALEHVVSNGGTPLEDLADEPLPPIPVNIKEDEDVRMLWRRETGQIRRRNKVRRSKRILVHQTVGVARLFADQRHFYFPHRLDFRGRAYPIPHWVQPQGPDVARSMLRFSDGAPLTPGGWRRLLIYGANLYGVKGTLDERAAWAVLQMPTIRRVHQDPVSETWWHDADEPFQFLAWCLEVGAALDAGWPLKPFITTLPVHVDASNNGLQLYALMTGDRELATATNVISSSDSQPQDIYSVVAERSLKTLEFEAEAGSTIARSLVGHFREKHGGVVPRACAKRPVMTLAYDVSLWSAQNYVYDWYVETRPKGTDPLAPDSGKKCRYLANVLLETTKEVCSGAVSGMSWLHAAAGAAAEQGTALRWTAPTGWPVVQEYRKSRSKVVKVALGGAMRCLHLRQPGDLPDKKKQIQGVAPNFVHSVDASVMSEALTKLRPDIPVAAIHDSFAVPAPHVEELLGVLRQAVVDVVLINQPLSRASSQFGSYIREWNEDPPRFGVIEPHEVLESEYLFS